jgi:hypothetical protein
MTILLVRIFTSFSQNLEAGDNRHFHGWQDCQGVKQHAINTIPYPHAWQLRLDMDAVARARIAPSKIVFTNCTAVVVLSTRSVCHSRSRPLRSADSVGDVSAGEGITVR